MPSGLLCALATRNLCRTARFGIVFCVGVELLQLVLPIGRVASSEDALVTSFGWIVGALLTQLALQVVNHGRVRADSSRNPRPLRSRPNGRGTRTSRPRS